MARLGPSWSSACAWAGAVRWWRVPRQPRACCAIAARVPRQPRACCAVAALLLLPALLLLSLSQLRLTFGFTTNASIELRNDIELPRDSGPTTPTADAESTRGRYVPGHARAHPELCGAGARLVMLVASAPAHSRRREAVRLTWGHAARRSDVALAFVLGAFPPSLRVELDAEDALYGDLVEARFEDSYGNLTLKTLSMLEWFVEHCPHAPRLLKTDDDMFINVEALLRFAEAPARGAGGGAVWGRVWRAGRPERNVSSKFFVPQEEFPGARYPPYANGPAYLVAGGSVRRLLRAALTARWLRMEDALVTGVAATAARVRRVDVPAFLRRPRDVVHACALRAAFAVHEVSYHEQFDLWRRLHDPVAKCPS